MHQLQKINLLESTTKIFSHLLHKNRPSHHVAFRTSGHSNMPGYPAEVTWIFWFGSSIWGLWDILILIFKSSYVWALFHLSGPLIRASTYYIPTHTLTYIYLYIYILDTLHGPSPLHHRHTIFPLEELSQTTRKSEYLNSAHPACLVVHGVIW